MHNIVAQNWKNGIKRALLSVALCLFPFDVILSSEEEITDVSSIDPAARVHKLEDALGKEFVQASKEGPGVSSAAKAVAGAKVWESTPPKHDQAPSEDPQIYGLDVSSVFDLQEISEPVGVYRYSAFGKPDPFLAPYDQFRQTRVAAMEIPIVSPLQVPLPQLKVAGLWELEDGSRKALILTQLGEGVIAKIGDPIGLSGKIIDIFSNGVVSRQYKIRADGSREFQDLTLSFGETERDSSTDKILLEPGKDPVVAAPERSKDGIVINQEPKPAPTTDIKTNQPPADVPPQRAAVPTGPVEQNQTLGGSL